MSGRLACLEAQAPVQVKVPEDLQDRLERLEARLQATMVTNQPIIDAVNTRRVDVNKLLKQQSSLLNGRKNLPFTTAPKSSPIPSFETWQTISLRAQARMETIDILFATGQTLADLTPMERPMLFTDEIAKVPLENIEHVRGSIR